MSNFAIEKYEQAEAAFRSMVSMSGLPEPDEVERGDGTLRFLWHADKVCVVIELED